MDRLRVLVAEDDAVVAEDLRSMLEDLGHTVSTVVHRADDAIEHASAHDVELALLDIRMPGACDGIDAGRRLAGEMDIPVVFVTAHADDETMERAWASGPVGYVLKPIRQRQLHSAIELAVRNHGRLRELREGVRRARRARNAYQRAASRYQRVFSESPVAAYIVRLGDGMVLDANRQFEDLFGWSAREVVGRTTDALRVWPGQMERATLHSPSGSGDGQEGPKVTCRTRGGGTCEVEVRIQRLEVEGEVAVLVLAQDVTRRTALEAELERMALYDALTGLPNRALFRDRLGHSLDRGRREDREVAVLFVDLDGFKTVNDTLGHAAGDEILAITAERLRRCFRDEDTVARLGGDEFAVVVVEKEGSSGARAGAERIREAMSLPFDVGGAEVSLSASVGVAVAPGDGRTAEELLRHSDLAMYRSKDAGGGAVTLGPRSRDALEDPGDVGDRIRTALLSGEMLLHFQPLVAIDSGRVLGAEALLRWQHPERGLLAPDDFVQSADDAGLTFSLGRRVLAMACRQLSAWGDRLPPDFFLSVNLDARHVGHPDLARDVEELLDTHGIEPRSLMLEVSEGLLRLTPDRLKALRDRGVRLAVDDFGTGRYPLAHWREIEADLIKIDGSLVAGIGASWVDFVVAKSIMLFADGLGLDVVAEGVETRAQLEALLELGCPMAQGYLFGEPCGGDELLGIKRPAAAAPGGPSS